MRRAARTDSNHLELVKAFRTLGCSVLSLAAVGKGVPDLLVSIKGITWLVEVKMPKGIHSFPSRRSSDLNNRKVN